MALFGSRKQDDDEMSLNDARVGRYKEDQPMFPESDDSKAMKVIEHYVTEIYDQLDKDELKKKFREEYTYLKKIGIL